MGADYEIRGDIAIITMNNQPVNSLGYLMRRGIYEGLKKALSDNSVKAIILTGAGKAFSGGVDIGEFNKPESFAEPMLSQLIGAIESADKPVVAAIHFLAMGGGLEVALGCHYRVADSSVKISCPEIKLGVIPGAGGTQRLPRVVGVETALNMIMSGNPLDTEYLANTKLFDKIIEGDLIPEALNFANMIANRRPLPKIRDIRIDFAPYREFFKKVRESVSESAKHLPALIKCIDCVAAALSMPFEEGIKLERTAFLELIQTTESKALRHYFFGVRSASKIPDMPKDTHERAINKAAVIGIGTMGRGIAMNFANFGFPVIVLEANQDALDKGLSIIHQNYSASMKKGKLTFEELEKRMNLIKGTIFYDEVRDADIVIEAVFEDITIKKEVFRKLDDIMKPGAILASNTSTIDINEIATFTRRPQDVLGTHFFNPAHVMKLLEVVRGDKTSYEVLASTIALSKRIGKTCVISRVCDGFIGNRMINQFLRQSVFLLEEGCFPEQVDDAIEEFGFAMGPFRMSDLVGNDVGWHIRKRRYIEHPEMTYSKIADILCEHKRFGQKVGAGWYDYKSSNRIPYPAQWVHNMIIDYSKGMGLKRRQIDKREIVERLVYTLVNEAAYILDEGIAQQASDIDIVYLMGYGFPMYRGGPMFYADTIGLLKVVEAMRKYEKGLYGDLWKPAPLLERLLAEGKTLVKKC